MKVELLCSCEKEELEKRIQKVAAAGKLSRFKGNVFEVLENCNDYEKNLKLIKRIISMGHKSIIEQTIKGKESCELIDKINAK